MGIDNVVGDKQTASGGPVRVVVRLKEIASTSQARIGGQSDGNLVGLHETACQFASDRRKKSESTSRSVLANQK